jgi:hypothetical protein
MRKYIFVTGIGVGLFAIAAAEGTSFAQPSQPACEWQPPYRDFGAPPGCGNEPGQHPRGTVVTSLATASSTAAMTSAIVVYDSEEVRLDQLPATTSESL